MTDALPSFCFLLSACLSAKLRSGREEEEEMKGNLLPLLSSLLFSPLFFPS